MGWCRRDSKQNMKPLKILLLLLSVLFTTSAANIKLVWDPNPPSDGVTGYKVYFKNNAFGGGIFSPIATVATNTFTLTNMSPGNFSFYVTATNAAGESPPSATVTTNVTTVVPVAVPVAPRNLVVQVLR